MREKISMEMKITEPLHCSKYMYQPPAQQTLHISHTYIFAAPKHQTYKPKIRIETHSVHVQSSIGKLEFNSSVSTYWAPSMKLVSDTNTHIYTLYISTHVYKYTLKSAVLRIYEMPSFGFYMCSLGRTFSLDE